MKPKQIKALQNRSKNLVVRVIDPVKPGEPYIVIVGSGTSASFNRIVTIHFDPDGHIHARCTCKWAEHGGVGCSHVLAALNALAARKHRALSFWLTPEEAQRQKQRVFRLTDGRREDHGENLWITSRQLTPSA